MNSAKIDEENGLVVNVALGLAKGYVRCQDGVAIGWSYDGTEFAPPEPKTVSPPTVEEAISALESSVTARWLRGAALGDEYAISRIQEVEDKIAELRE